MSLNTHLVASVAAACALLLGAACSGDRSAEGLGPAYAQYVAARDQKPANDELTLRRFYDAYLEVLRTRDPKKALRFFRPDVEPEARNAIRMGLEFVKLLDSLSGELLEVHDLGGRALLKTREAATFKFQNRPTTDRRDRSLQLIRLGRDWYLESPDLGPARKAR